MFILKYTKLFTTEVQHITAQFCYTYLKYLKQILVEINFFDEFLNVEMYMDKDVSFLTLVD